MAWAEIRAAGAGRATRHVGLEGAGAMPSSKSATLLGAGAILLWATLASLTALRGPIPPFQTTAIVFAVGGSVRWWNLPPRPGGGAFPVGAPRARPTALGAPPPPFQTPAIVLAGGGWVVLPAAPGGGRLALVRPPPASLALGIAGLFGYHAL